MAQVDYPQPLQLLKGFTPGGGLITFGLIAWASGAFNPNKKRPVGLFLLIAHQDDSRRRLRLLINIKMIAMTGAAIAAIISG
jgi:hypothetical protein